MATIQQMASTAYDAMTRGERDNGGVFYHFRDDAPDWCGELSQAVHNVGGADMMLPDDFRYAALHSFLSDIADMEGDADAIRDESHERVDAAVDVYNHNLATWLGSHLWRGEYVNDAIVEFGAPKPFDIWKALQYGQYAELSEIFHAIVSFLDDIADDD